MKLVYILRILEQNCITILDSLKEKTVLESYRFCENFFANNPVELTELAIDADLKHPMINNYYKDSHSKVKAVAVILANWVFIDLRIIPSD